MKTATRRVVTGHDPRGLAIVHQDSELPALDIGGGIAKFTLVWTTDRSPASNNDAMDGAQRAVGLTSPGGTVLRLVDFKPGMRSPMHRTSSIDYGIVLDGLIDLELDSGEVRHLKAGDVVIQRGTNHAWHNPGQSWSRMAFVLVDAEPARVGNRVLEEILT
jgi:quercetin dioxygenase-like cupin family protein